MLADIQEKLGIKEDVDTELLKNAISKNQLWALSWGMPGIVDSSPNDSPPELDEVQKILDMWRFIEEAHATFDDLGKARIATEADPFGTDVKFGGFDANEESDHYGIATFLIEDLGRFKHFNEHELNSHFPLIEVYRRMLAVFSPIRKTLASGILTEDQVIALLNAMHYQEGS